MQMGLWGSGVDSRESIVDSRGSIVGSSKSAGKESGGTGQIISLFIDNFLNNA